MWDYAMTGYNPYLYGNIPSRFEISAYFTPVGHITDSQPYNTSNAMNPLAGLYFRRNPEAIAFIPGATRHGESVLTNNKPEISRVPGNMEHPVGIPRPDPDVHTYVHDFRVSGHDSGHDVSNGLKVGRRKMKKKRSAKQMERTRLYRERKYGNTTTGFCENQEMQRSRTIDIDIINSEEIEPLSRSVENAGLEAANNVETTYALSEDEIIEGCGIFAVLTIYTNSGLHCKLEESAKIIKEASDDEDFGYKYFTLSNLLK